MRSAFLPHARVQSTFNLPSRAKQSMMKECDINQIMAKFAKTGMIEHVKTHGAHYGEMPEAEDFHSAMNLITDATRVFEELPSHVRANFNNDPADFLEFISDPENLDGMIELGLISPPDVSDDDPDSLEGDTPPESNDAPTDGAAPA